MSRAEIAAEGMTLEPGQQVRIVCPFCGGGSTQERCMSLRLDGDTGLLLYHCFRGNCDKGSGIIGNYNSDLVRTRTVRKFDPWDDSALIPCTSTLAPDGARIYLAELGLDPQRGQVLYDPRDDRVCYTITGPRSELRGYVRRAYRKGISPKAITGRVRDDCPMLSWYYHDRSPSRIFLVEDCPSAMRLVGVGETAVALLGNTPSDAAMAEIVEEANRSAARVIVALDPDAKEQGVRLMRAFSFNVEASAIFPSRDFKNMSDREITDCLANVT